MTRWQGQLWRGCFSLEPPWGPAGGSQHHQHPVASLATDGH